MLDTRPAALGPVELARFLWRQLTSMRTALVLLFLLTLAALPGSFVPQRGVDPLRVQQFAEDSPTLATWYERLSLFDVYSSPWFAATYLLLFVSLVGCVLPRSRAHWAAVRARPPAAPRNLDRLPIHESWSSDARPGEVLTAARAALGRRYRVDVSDAALAAERGHWRETGNLVFHLALLLLLLAVALGSLFGFRANVLVVEGRGFSNTYTAYDTFNRGAAFDEERGLAPFTMTLDRLTVRYQRGGEKAGEPRDFRAAVTYTSDPDGPPRSAVLRVNHPVVVRGTKVLLLGNGYAPEFTVRDRAGEVVFAGPVPFLPDDAAMTSSGVVKVPGAQPEELGFEGFFLPTAVFDPARGPVSVFPDLRLPRAVLTAWTGDLGYGDGSPQSVYSLDKDGLTQVRGDDGEPFAQSLGPGETMTLPDGASITFEGVRRWASLQVARNPGTTPALAAALLALAGLTASLFVRRRRLWVRASTADDGRTLVEVAGLSRTDGEARDDLAAEVASLSAAVRVAVDGTTRGDR